jgi:hypothetical protein
MTFSIPFLRASPLPLSLYLSKSLFPLLSPFSTTYFFLLFPESLLLNALPAKHSRPVMSSPEWESKIYGFLWPLSAFFLIAAALFIPSTKAGLVDQREKEVSEYPSLRYNTTDSVPGSSNAFYRQEM